MNADEKLNRKHRSIPSHPSAWICVHRRFHSRRPPWVSVPPCPPCYFGATLSTGQNRPREEKHRRASEGTDPKRQRKREPGHPRADCQAGSAEDQPGLVAESV